MPILDNFDNLVDKSKEIKDVFDKPESQKARKDFNYLVSNCGLSCRADVKHDMVFASTGLVGDFVAISAKTSDKMITFTKDIVTKEDNSYLAVVLYNGDKVQGVYAFDFKLFKEKAGLFSIYKNIEKKNEYGLVVKGYEKKWAQNKFTVLFQKNISTM